MQDVGVDFISCSLPGAGDDEIQFRDFSEAASNTDPMASLAHQVITNSGLCVCVWGGAFCPRL